VTDPVTEEEKSHSELPPSSADKWFHCHAWRRLVWGLPDQSSEAAEEGTFAHEWYAAHLLGERDLKDLDNAEMSDYLFMCSEWIGEQEGQLHVEQTVDFGSAFGFVGLTGTADNILVHPKHLTIGDLKYGRHVVEVEQNLQLLIYLVGAVEKFGPRDRYRLVILQPRAKHDKGPIREWMLSHAELEAFKADLHLAIKNNYDPRSKPTVGEYCRKWCKALGRCPAAADLSLQLFREASEDDE
jgi:hypothetical protein